MNTRARRSLAIGALLVLALATDLRAADSAAAGELTVEGTYTHPSGMTFPTVVSDATRVSIHRYAELHDDVGVSYALGTPAAGKSGTGTTESGVVSIFVYPAPTSDLMMQLMAGVESIQQEHGVAPTVAHECTLEFGAETVPCKTADFTWVERFGGSVKPRPLSSVLYVLQRGSWSIDYRVTGPTETFDSIQPTVQDLLRLTGFALASGGETSRSSPQPTPPRTPGDGH